MSSEAISLFSSLLAINRELWGVQRIPDGSPLGSAGYIVSIGKAFFRADTLEGALTQALAWWKEQQDAVPGQ